MNMNEALQQSLYDKLSREQDKYRDWLKGQPPEEILHHSYEYTVREDILMSMEELTLREAETRALLLSATASRTRQKTKQKSSGSCRFIPIPPITRGRMGSWTPTARPSAPM